MAAAVTNTPSPTPAVGSPTPADQKVKNKNAIIAAAVAGGLAAVAAFFISLSLGVPAPIAAVIAVGAGGIAAVIAYVFVSRRSSNPDPVKPVRVEIPEDVRRRAAATVQRANAQIAQVTNDIQQREQQAIIGLQQEIQQFEQRRQELAQKHAQDTNSEEMQRLYKEAQDEYNNLNRNPDSEVDSSQARLKTIEFEPTRRLKRLQENFQYENKLLDLRIGLTFDKYTMAYIGSPTRERILAPYRKKYGTLVPQ